MMSPPYDRGIGGNSLEVVVDRRSFLMTLVGGLAAAGMGGIAAAEAAQPKVAPPAPAPQPEPAQPKGDETVTAEMKKALDKTDAEFSQYYYYRRPRYYRRRYW